MATSVDATFTENQIPLTQIDTAGGEDLQSTQNQEDTPQNDLPTELKKRTPEEEEEEYRKFQEKITQEQMEESKRKVEQILSNSNYTSASQLVGPPGSSSSDANSPNQAVSWGKPCSSPDLNIGSLLRLFKSDFFDSWIGISYLYRYPSSGVHDYLCNALYNMPDDDIEFYLVELCTMLVHAEFGSAALERFIMDKCKQSVHFALQINWLMQASMADSEEKRVRAEGLQDKVEIAAVNGTYEQPQMSSLWNSQNQDHCNESASDLLRMQMEGTLHLKNSPRSSNPSSSAETPSQSDSLRGHSEAHISLSASPLATVTSSDDVQALQNGSQLTEESNEQPNVVSDDGPKHFRSLSFPGFPSVEEEHSITVEALEKLDRCDYFYKVLNFVEDLGRISEELRLVPVPLRQQKLELSMNTYNETLPVGIYLPLWEASTPHFSICKIVAEESKVLKSRERVPFLLLVEAITSPEASSSRTVHKFAHQVDQKAKEVRSHNENNPSPSDSNLPTFDSSSYADSPFGEPFEQRVERIRKESIYGKMEGWHVRSVIVKYGDDCRQEYLAMQLITQFKKIFDDAKLPLYVRPYRILVNSTDSGIIETVTDAISIHQLKRFYNPETPISLIEHFRKFYGDGTDQYHKAVRNFVESLAGYSLVSFLLQIKDRHNGNLLLDSEGHLIHIDFGFMLSNSPGSINAENVPFKFTQEYLELMGGFQGPMFQYFKEILLKGYMEVRKQSEKIILLVEIMAVGSKLPCFYAGQNTIDALRDRFNLRMPERQVVEFVEGMLQQSYDSWRTRYYDRFQYMTNNILY